MRRIAPLVPAVGIAAVVLFGLSAGGAAERIVAIGGCYALMAIGYHLVFGLGGALSLAQGAFFGIGAYAFALALAPAGWGGALALAALVPAAVALIVGRSVLRLETHYFALATLALAQAALILAVEWLDLTGGANGVAFAEALPALARALRADPRDAVFMLGVLLWLAVALAGWMAARIGGGLSGAALAAQRQSPLGADAAGLDAQGRRLVLFALGAALAGWGGAGHATLVRVVSPETLDFALMVSCLAMTVIGGRLHPAGAAAGALLLAWLADAVRALETWSMLLFGAALLLAILAAPDGLVGLWHRLFRHGETAPEAKSPEPVPCAVPAGEPALRMTGLGKSFGGNRALAEFSLDLAPGEIVGLIGPNGSGKTTALNLASGAERADAGSVTIAGLPAPDGAWRRARAGLGRTFQTPALPPDLSALDAVAVVHPAVRSRSIVAAMLGGPRTAGNREARRGAAAMLRRCGVADPTRTCAALSPAEARRVELARALIGAPAAILLDEPGSGLAAVERAALAAAVRHWAGRGFAFLIVDHNMEFLLPLAARVVCLEGGRILASGTPSEIAAHPEVRRLYLGGAARVAA